MELARQKGEGKEREGREGEGGEGKEREGRRVRGRGGEYTVKTRYMDGERKRVGDALQGAYWSKGH